MLHQLYMDAGKYSWQLDWLKVTLEELLKADVIVKATEPTPRVNSLVLAKMTKKKETIGFSGFQQFE